MSEYTIGIALYRGVEELDFAERAQAVRRYIQYAPQPPV
jgi:hypothetical protein